MAVDDHGLEVLKKAGEEVTPGDKSDYYLKVGVVDGGTFNVNLGGSPLKDVNWDYYAYNGSGPTTDIWTFKTGGSGGTTVATFTQTYTDSSKTVVIDGTWS